MKYQELEEALNLIELIEFGSDEREFKVEQSDINDFIVFTTDDSTKDEVATITPINLNIEDELLKASQMSTIFNFYKALKGA